MNINLTHGILVLGVSHLLVSCAGMGLWVQRSHCPVVPVSTEDHLDDVELRSRMHFSMKDREAHFEVVARRVSEELVVGDAITWKVRAVDLWGPGEWTEDNDFVVIAVPEPPKVVVQEESGGCATVPAAGWIWGLMLVAVGARRRSLS